MAYLNIGDKVRLSHTYRNLIKQRGNIWPPGGVGVITAIEPDTRYTMEFPVNDTTIQVSGIYGHYIRKVKR